MNDSATNAPRNDGREVKMPVMTLTAVIAALACRDSDDEDDEEDAGSGVAEEKHAENAREIVDTGAHEKKIPMEKRAKGGAKMLPKTVTCQHVDEGCGTPKTIDVHAEHAAAGVDHIDALNV
jgi:hypothetical protein